MEQSAKSTELPAKSFTRKFIFMRIKLIFLMFCTRNCFETEAQKKVRNWPIYTNAGRVSRHLSFDSKNV